MKLLSWAVLSFFLCSFLASAPLAACGPFAPEIRFWYAHRPAPPLDDFLAGEIGVIDRRFGRHYLFVAYRHLAGLGLIEKDREALAGLFGSHFAPEGFVRPVDRWLEARRAVPGAEKKRWIFVDKSVEKGEGPGRYHYYFPNCLDDAFLTAARTLERYISEYGAGAPETKAWLDAQDQVFALCDSDGPIPPPLAPGAEVLLSADRDYQIAAAYFYACDYGEAEKRFRRIAEDDASPWQHLGRYLVGRALHRSDRDEAAIRHFQTFAEESGPPELRASAHGLIDHIRFGLEHETRGRELAELLHRRELAAGARQHLRDYLMYAERRYSVPVQEDLRRVAGEAGAFVRAVGWPDEGGVDFAVERWRKNGALPWLAASLILAEPSHPEAEELILAAARVGEDSPAYLTVSYHRYRLLAGQGRLEALRGELEHLHGEERLRKSDKNRFAALRAGISHDVADYLRWTQQDPVELVYDGVYGGSELPSDLGSWRAGEKLFLGAAADLLNRGVRTADLLDLVREGVIAPELRRRVALAAMTRAFALGDDTSLERTLPLIRELAPELVDEVEAIEAASGEERFFTAALAILRLPGLHPDVHAGEGRETPTDEIDGLRANWWCPSPGVDAVESPLPGFVDPDLAAVERRKLRLLESGPNHLGRQVLAWADAAPSDPRVPEALHRLVRATRFGCPLEEGGYATISRAAFEKLHGCYPKSPWAAKTKYWFD